MPEDARGSRRTRPEQRRRRVRQRIFDDSVPSPCISVCTLDEASDLCLGCRRSMEEIRDWPIMSAEDKRATLARVAERTARGLPAGARGGPPETV